MSSAAVPSASLHPSSASLNAAVQRCCEAYEHAYAAAMAAGNSYDADRDAARAFRKAMPFLNAFENVQTFITCAAQGVILGALSAGEGSRLIYAAQVAVGLARQKPALDAQPPATDMPARPDPTPAPAQPEAAPAQPQSARPQSVKPDRTEPPAVQPAAPSIATAAPAHPQIHTPDKPFAGEPAREHIQPNPAPTYRPQPQTADPLPRVQVLKSTSNPTTIAGPAGSGGPEASGSPGRASSPPYRV